MMSKRRHRKVASAPAPSRGRPLWVWLALAPSSSPRFWLAVTNRTPVPTEPPVAASPSQRAAIVAFQHRCLPADGRQFGNAQWTRTRGMVWIPGGEFSMGAADPPGIDRRRRHAGHDRFAADSSRLRRRLLDGHDRGDQRAVRGVREGHRLRHRRRADAARRRFSRRAAGEPGGRLGRLHAAAITPCR